MCEFPYTTTLTCLLVSASAPHSSHAVARGRLGGISSLGLPCGHWSQTQAVKIGPNTCPFRAISMAYFP